MKDADQLKKETIGAKNDAETLGYQVEKQLEELKEKMSTADADELKSKLEDLRPLQRAPPSEGTGDHLQRGRGGPVRRVA